LPPGTEGPGSALPRALRSADLRTQVKRSTFIRRSDEIYAIKLRSTVQLIQTELFKAYLHRALRCNDSDPYDI